MTVQCLEAFYSNEIWGTEIMNKLQLMKFASLLRSGFTFNCSVMLLKMYLQVALTAKS